MMRVIRATAIPTAKLWSACNGVSANRAVNCRDSSPVFPCARPMYLVWKLRHCSGGLNPLTKFILKSLHRRHFRPLRKFDWPFLKAEENQNLLRWIGGDLVPSVPEPKSMKFFQWSIVHP